MSSGRSGLRWPWGLVFLILWGCQHPIQREYREEAVRDVPFQEIRRDPSAYVGSTVIWGGEVIETVNLPRETEIIILQTPLGREGRPEEPIRSEGRFIARAPDFLDPDVYEKGRRVTVAGEITGVESRPLGKMEYAYPILRIRQIHLWREEQPLPPYYYGDPWGWYGPTFLPHYYPYYPYYPYHPFYRWR